ncbi:hypothetical protein TVAG_175630 [Trichomonas vaginalis G3]|uniref:Uncharacterized protein n=1 Tax=Trichomonas vaginalis (strain ATCC PRA-98 / G3) TaxID=412133 RepID=A2F5N1_TRIV3|nr:solute carrier family 35 member F6 family [Trichomonas vaginalis G3]EAX99794.1 hypothetical protein TVAG_175630 [Trichomonas vaginalis G3]KAI5494428.1 solute carrier family 35 member F6 family [Trichomonas vaginalis G3]|eukprot:XP_001312724.1 hypothetical protein [Trichomonas vaginalis G3]
MVLFLIYIPISTTYNGCLIGTIATTNAITYTIIEMIGSFLTWIVDLIIYHGFHGKFILHSNGKIFGTKWTKYSYLRLIGSVIYFIGFLIYSGVIKFKCFTYPQSNVRLMHVNPYESGSSVEQII